MAHHLMLVYICTNFNEDTFKSFKDIGWTWNIILKLCKSDLDLCTLS